VSGSGDQTVQIWGRRRPASGPPRPAGPLLQPVP